MAMTAATATRITAPVDALSWQTDATPGMAAARTGWLISARLCTTQLRSRAISTMTEMSAKDAIPDIHSCGHSTISDCLAKCAQTSGQRARSSTASRQAGAQSMPTRDLALSWGKRCIAPLPAHFALLSSLCVLPWECCVVISPDYLLKKMP